MSDNFPGVEPHGSLEPIFENAWFLTGSVAFKPLVRLSRNMVVLRHGDELTLINSVRLNAEGEAALDALGKVTHVMKIGFHSMDDPYYLDRYDANYWVIDGTQDQYEEGSVSVLSEQAELPIPDLTVFLFQETVKPEGALLLEREGGLLITCDSVQHWKPSKFLSPLAKVLTQVMGFKKPAQIGPPWSKVQTRKGGSLKPDFERLVDLPFQRIIGGHGGLLESNGPELLKASIQRKYG